MAKNRHKPTQIACVLRAAMDTAIFEVTQKTAHFDPNKKGRR